MELRATWIGYVAAVLVAAPAPAVAGIDVDVELDAIEDVEVLSLTDLLEAPVTAASRYAQKPGGSPMLVSQVDAELIERFGYRTVADAVRGLRGMYATNDRNYSYLGSRGFSVPGDYNTRFSLAIDDHRMNDPIYGQATPGAELGMPMIAVERIELLRGGAWSVHGESAMLGAIQIIAASGATRPGLRVQTSGRAALESYDDPADRPAIAPRGQDVAASYGALARGVDVFVAASYSYDPGLAGAYYPELVTPESTGLVSGGDAEEVGSIYGAVKARGFALRVLAASRRKLVNTGSYGSSLESPTETFDDRMYADLSYTRASEHADLVARVSLDRYQYIGAYPFTDGDARYLNLDDGDAAWGRAELRGRLKRARWGAHLRDLELGFGGVASSGYATQANGDRDASGNTTEIFDRTDLRQMAGLFGHASARAFDHVVGFAALRGDYVTGSDGLIVNPQLGLVLDGGEHGRLRASLARGYRAPNAFEQYYSAEIAGVAPQPLAPERSRTLELSFERYLGDHVRLLLVGFRQEVTNLISVTESATDSSLFTNQGGIESHGVEGELEGRWDRVRLRVTGTRLHTRTLDGMRPPNSPASLASLLVMTPVAGGRAEIGVESYFIGERAAFNGTVLDPTFSTNVVATIHRIAQGLDLDLGVTNVFDERSSDPSSEEHTQSRLPHDPRIAWLRLRLELP